MHVWNVVGYPQLWCCSIHSSRASCSCSPSMLGVWLKKKFYWNLEHQAHHVDKPAVWSTECSSPLESQQKFINDLLFFFFVCFVCFESWSDLITLRLKYVYSRTVEIRKWVAVDFTPNNHVTFPLIFGFITMWVLFIPQVFNLNAPVPPANEAEALNQASQYQSYNNQAFSSQPQHPVEQTEMQPEQLQSGGQTLNFIFAT